MAAVRKSPRTTKKSPPKPIPGNIKKITPLRKSKTPTKTSTFRTTRTSKPSSSTKTTDIFSSPSNRKKSKSNLLPLIRLDPRLGKSSPSKTTPGKSSPSKTTPGKSSPSKTTPGKSSPSKTTKKLTPSKTLASLKPKTPVKKGESLQSSGLASNNQFLYISLSICSGLILFVLILFCFYKLYEYLYPGEKSSTDNIDFMEDLEDIDANQELESKEAREAREAEESDKTSENKE